MDKAILLIDRGSKEREVREELFRLCSMISSSSDYEARYCFLEVTPPYIEDGMRSLADKQLTIIPYFLYPGLKLKQAILESERIAKSMNINPSIGDCLHFHPNLVKIIMNRVREAKEANNILLDNSECDLLLIGHGSSDIDARLAFEEVYEEVRDNYRNAGYAFLELDEPNISDGISKLLVNDPKVLIIMPYFLHNGTHMKHDIMLDIDKAIRGAKCRVIITKHLGVSREMVEIIIDRARCYEGKGY